MRRHYNTASTARTIVDELAGAGSKVTLDIQDEMVNRRRDLSQTSAGQELQSEMAAEKAKLATERAELERDVEELRPGHEKHDHETMVYARSATTTPSAWRK